MPRIMGRTSSLSGRKASRLAAGARSLPERRFTEAEGRAVSPPRLRATGHVVGSVSAILGRTCRFWKIGQEILAAQAAGRARTIGSRARSSMRQGCTFLAQRVVAGSMTPGRQGLKPFEAISLGGYSRS